MGNCKFTETVRPPSLWQTNFQNYQSFSAHVLALLGISFCFDHTKFNVFACLVSDENKGLAAII